MSYVKRMRAVRDGPFQRMRNKSLSFYKEMAKWAVRRVLVGASEQRIFAIQCQRPDRWLDGVGVELDAAIVEEHG